MQISNLAAKIDSIRVTLESSKNNMDGVRKLLEDDRDDGQTITKPSISQNFFEKNIFQVSVSVIHRRQQVENEREHGRDKKQRPPQAVPPRRTPRRRRKEKREEGSRGSK